MALFNPRVMKEALAQPRPIPEQHLDALKIWAAKVRDGSIDAANETQLEGQFASIIVERVLGYTPLMTGKTPVICEIAEAKKVAWCGCRESKNKPFCDGTHRTLPPKQP